MTADYTPTTEEVREFVESTYQAAICRGEVPADLKRTGLAAFDRWLASVKADAWDEGSQAGLDTGLEIAELVHQNQGRLPLPQVPPPPTNPYRTKETP